MSLKRRFVILILLVLAPIFGLTTAGFVYIKTRAGLLSARTEARNISATLSTAVRSLMLAHQSEAIEQALVLLAGREPVVRIRIYSKRGEPVFSSDRASTVSKDSPTCTPCHDSGSRERIIHTEDGKHFVSIFPIESAPGCASSQCHPSGQTVLGVTEIETDLEPSLRSARIGALLIAILGVISLVITSIAVNYILAKRILDPLSSLIEATQHLAEGELHHRVELKAKDELGLLASSFNRMAENLHSAWETAQRKLEKLRLHSMERLSHQLRSPVSGLLTSLKTLRFAHSKSLSPEGEDFLNRAVVKAETLLHLAERVSLLFSIRTFTSSSVPESVSLEALGALLDDYRASAQGVGKELSFSPVPDARVLCEERLLKLALQELFENSLHYSTSRIELRFEESPDEVAIILEDDSPTLSDEELPHLTDEFYRTKSARQLNPSGTGLGLALVKEIIEWSGGSLELSRLDPQGLRATIHLRKEVQDAQSSHR